MTFLKGPALMAGSLHDAALFGRKRQFSVRAKPLVDEPAKPRKPFSRMSREELAAYAKGHVHLKSRTSVGRMFPGFYLALKDEKNKGLIDELFPLKKPMKPPRERRNLKSMSDDQMILYFRKHYAGKIKSWSGLMRKDHSFHLNFVQIRELHTKVSLDGEPLAARGI